MWDWIPKRKRVLKQKWQVRAEQSGASVTHYVRGNTLEDALAKFREDFPTAEVTEISKREDYYW